MLKPTVAQKRIRDHEALNLLVVAPAGCGKTEALALRIAGLLERGTVAHPCRVLVTTFSNRARDNIRDRLRSHVPFGVMRDRVTISNFHGFSARLVRAHAGVIGLDADLLLPENDWVREQCQSRGLGFQDAGTVQEILRQAKQQPADDAGVQQYILDTGNSWAHEIELQRVQEKRLTYDDLPRLAELILANDVVAELYRSHFSAVIVDEFQDLTPQQLRIVNRIGYGKTTYAGDLAQGIYGFAGAMPEHIDAAVRQECSEVVDFAESHRSSPAVLRMVNSLSGLTGGQELTCADPDSWPGGGLAGGVAFASATQEASWVVKVVRGILERAPNHRVGVIGRLKGRLRFVDQAAEASGLPVHRWEDGVLDTDTAQLVKAMLSRLNLAELARVADPVDFLRDLAGLDQVQEPDTRVNLADALSWCLDRLRDGLAPEQVRRRIKVGDESTLLNVPGLHLLSGHVGKGQQFDWVVVVGAEEGCIPDFRSTDIREEARILSVMISRARHGAIVTFSRNVPTNAGAPKRRTASPFWTQLGAAGYQNADGVSTWLQAVDWDTVAVR